MMTASYVTIENSEDGMIELDPDKLPFFWSMERS